MSDFNFVCNVYHRDVTNSQGGSSRQVHIEPSSGNIGRTKILKTGDFDFTMAVTRPSDWEVGTVRVGVALREPRSVSLRQLYQMSEAPKQRFAGGHGFTGLNYVQHPDEKHELQFSCEHTPVGESELAGMRVISQEVDYSNPVDAPRYYQMQRLELYREIPIDGADADAFVDGDQFYLRHETVNMLSGEKTTWFGPFSMDDARAKAPAPVEPRPPMPKPGHVRSPLDTMPKPEIIE